jgi:hypothetical protein
MPPLTDAIIFPDNLLKQFGLSALGSLRFLDELLGLGEEALVDVEAGLGNRVDL